MLLGLLPNRFERQVQVSRFQDFEPRCGHSNSLSRAIHALVAAGLGQLDLAALYFREAAAIDLEDTTAGIAGGVRIVALGGLWQAAILRFRLLGPAVPRGSHAPSDRQA